MGCGLPGRHADQLVCLSCDDKSALAVQKLHYADSDDLPGLGVSL